MSITIGTDSRYRRRLANSRPNGSGEMTPCAFRGSGGFTNCCPMQPRNTWSPSGKGKPCCKRPIRSPATSVSSPRSLYLQYEGMNPSGSFKDNGMSAAFTHANLDRCEAGCLCLDRQHECFAGDVLLSSRG